MMWMMLWGLVFWIAVIGAAGWLFVGRGRGSDGDALEMLRQRLARGDIDIDEFRRREEALHKTAHRGSSRGWIALAIAFAVGLFIVVPMIAMAANGWDWNMDMWDMHGQGRNTSGYPIVRAGLEADVAIDDFAFEPGNLQVPVGATVTWTNEESAPHDATARNGDWRTERLSKGDRDSLIFDKAGEFDYYCSIHPSMKARLTVR